MGPQRSPYKTIALVDFVTVPQEGDVLELFKILIHVHVCLVHGIVVVFVIPCNDKDFREVSTDKLHERVILGLTRIANVPRQDTDFARLNLFEKDIDVFDVFQMEVGHVANVHCVEVMSFF